MIEHQTQEHIDLDIESPWPGLHEFNEQDTDYFNGRVEETAALVRLIRNETLTVLFGRSGLGKTSLLRAGLFPKLRQKQWLPVYIRLDFSMDSGPLIEQVRSRFIQELENRRVDHQDFSDGETLWEYLHRPDRELWSSTNELLTPIFIFDQFEEIFTLGAANVHSVKQFRADLSDLIENRIPGFLVEGLEESGSSLDLRSHQYKVLLSFREDYLPDMESWRIEIPSIMRNRLRLMPMNGTQAFYAVFNTGKNLVNEEISRDIVRFVAAAQVDVGASSVRQASTGIHAPTEQTGSQPIEDLIVEPALLSLVCYELNERRKIAGKQHIDQGLLQGTGSAILTEFYEKSTKDLPQQTRRFIQENLVTESGFRNSYPRDDALNQHLITEEELEHLIHKRLLRVESQMGTDRIELIHDLLTGVVCEFRNRDRDKVQREIERQKWRKRLWVSSGIGFAVLSVFIFIAIYQNSVNASLLQHQKVLQTQKEKLKKQKKVLEESFSIRLVYEAQNIFSGQQPGGDERALLKLLAAYRINSNHQTKSFLLEKSLELKNLYKLITVEAQANSLSYSHDGKRIVSCNNDSTLQQWNALTGGKIGSSKHTSLPIHARFSPDDKQILFGCSDGSLRLWNTKVDTSSIKQLNRSSYNKKNKATIVAYSPDSTQFVSGYQNGTLQIWNAKKNQLVTNLTGKHKGWVSHIAYSPTGDHFVSASYDGTLRIWDAENGNPIGKHLRGHNGKIFHVAYSPTGDHLVSAGSDSTLRVWSVKNIDTKEQILIEHNGAVHSVEYSPDGRYFVSGSSDSTLLIWNAKDSIPSGRLLGRHEGSVSSVRFSPDGRHVASAGRDGTVRIWNAKIKTFNQPINVNKGAGDYRSALSPDGKRIVFGYKDGTLKLWDPINEKQIVEHIAAHNRTIYIIMFSPDGKRIVSGSWDGTLRLWDAENGKSIGQPLAGHRSSISHIFFSPDNSQVISGSRDGVVRFWPITPKVLCKKLTRNMSKTEWKKWVSPEIGYVIQCPDLPVPENNRSSTAQIQK